MEIALSCRGSLRWLALAAGASFGACADLPSTPPDREAAFSIPRNGELLDGGIEPTDTYFAVDVSSNTRVGSPIAVGGVALAGGYSEASYAAAWNNRYVEVGYDASGQLRVSVYRGPSSDPAIESPPSLIRVSGGAVSVYGQTGALLSQNPFYEFLAGAGLPGGSTVNGTPIYVYGCNYDAYGNCSGGGWRWQ